MHSAAVARVGVTKNRGSALMEPLADGTSTDLEDTPFGDDVEGGQEANKAVKARVHHLRMIGVSSYWFGSSSFVSSLNVLVLPDRVSKMVSDESRSIVVGLISSLTGVLSGIIGPVAGNYSDRTTSRYGRRTPWLVCGVLITLACTVPMIFGGWWEAMWLFAPAFVLAQSSLSIASGPFTAILPDIIPASQMGAASGYMGLMDMLGTTFGAAVMGLMANSFMERFQSYYVPIAIILALALALGTGVTLLSTREKPFVMKPSDVVIYHGCRSRLLSILQDFRAPFRSRDFFWVFWTRFLMMAGIASVRGNLQFWFDDVVPRPYILFGALTLPDAQAATSMFLLPLLVGATIAALLAGVLSDYFGRKVMVYSAGAIQGCTAVGMIFLPMMNAVVVLGFFFGLGYGAYQSVDFALAADVLPDAKSTAKDLGVWGVSGTLASIFAPLIAGFVLDTFRAVGLKYFESKRLGYTVLFCFATGLFILSTVLVSLIKAGGRKKMEEIPLERVVPSLKDQAEKSTTDMKEPIIRSDMINPELQQEHPVLLGSAEVKAV